MKTNAVQPLRIVAILIAALSFGPVTAGQNIVVTAEAPGVQATTVAGVTTMDFDATPLGVYTSLSSPIGTYTSPGLAIVNPDQYGGANQTPYLAVGAQSGQLEATLNLNSPQAYLGMYWGAADPSNILDFYSGGELLASFHVSDIIPLLPSTGGPFGSGNFGNPNNGQNPFEPYVYLNFFGTDGLTFDQLVFRTSTLSAGFETDNHSVRATEVTPPFPGTVVATLLTGVPEPSSCCLLVVGAVGLFFVLER